MKRLLTVILLTSALALAGCSSMAPAADGAASSVDAASDSVREEAYHKITAEEAKEMIDAGDVTVVDVRTQAEYDEAHIPGAILVPNEEIGDEPPEALTDQAAVLLVHCRTGIRSKAASDKLVELGYEHVYDFGGIVDWPYETEATAS